MRMIQDRKKRFWTFVLAVILGILPTVTVMADTFSIVKNPTTANCTDHSVKYNGVELSRLTVPLQTTSTGATYHMIFYAYTGDVIESEEAKTKAVTLTFKDGGNNPDPGTTAPSWVGGKVTLCAPGDLWNAENVLGWKVDLSINASNPTKPAIGVLQSIEFSPVDVFSITYSNYNNVGPSAASLAAANTGNIKYMPRTPGLGDFDVNIHSITDIEYTFEGWYSNNGSDKYKVQKLRYHTHAGGDSAGLYAGIDKNGDGVITGAAGTAEWPEIANGEVTNSATLYAKWTGNDLPPEPPGPIEITLEPNGGGGDPYKIPISNGKVTLPECTFTPPAGFLFAGWGPDLLQPGDEYNVQGEWSMNAEWKENTTYDFDLKHLYVEAGSILSKKDLQDKILQEAGIVYNPKGMKFEELIYFKDRGKIEKNMMSFAYSGVPSFRDVSQFKVHLTYSGLGERTIEGDVIVHLNSYSFTFGVDNTLEYPQCSTPGDFEKDLLGSIVLTETSADADGNKHESTAKVITKGTPPKIEKLTAEIIKAAPSEDLPEVFVDYSMETDINAAVRRLGSYPVTINADPQRRGLTLSVTGSVVITDPNLPVMREEDLGDFIVYLPDSVPFKGKVWNKQFEEMVYGVYKQTGEIVHPKKLVIRSRKGKMSVKVLLFKVKLQGNTKEENKQIAKKLNKAVRNSLKENRKITIRNFIVTPDNVSGIDYDDAGTPKVIRVKTCLDTEKKIKSKKNKFEMHEAEKTVSFNKPYTGTLTYEELGLKQPS